MTWNTHYTGELAYVTNSDTPGIRYEVAPDSDVSDPILDSGAPVEHYIVRSGYHSTSDTPGGAISEAFSRFNDEHDNALDVTRRFARIFHDYTESEANNRIALVETRGHSQGDWAELFVHVSEDGYGTAESWANEWAMYARGDVFGVTVQTLNSCDSCDCDDWEDGDSLWGVYADDAEEAAQYFARDHM